MSQQSLSKKLVIIPGSGSPKHPQYQNMYRLVADIGVEVGYKNILDNYMHPGQVEQGQRIDSNGSLTFNNCADKLLDVLSKIDSCDEKFDIYARSFGCLVVAFALSRNNYKNLNRTIMWGPPVYHSLYEKFVVNRVDYIRQLQAKLVNIDEKYFDGVVPFESSIMQVKNFCVIATGADDDFCPAEYLKYIEWMAQKKKNLKFFIAPNCKHEIYSDDRNVIKRLFFVGQ